MKRFLIAFFGIIQLNISLIAQNDTIKADTNWVSGGQFVFTLSQANFNNWAAGGDNSYSGNARLGLYLNYTKLKTTWENNLDLAYGLVKQDGYDLRKNDDIIEFISKFGHRASKKWNYSSLFGLKTQFYKGYKYFLPDSTLLISNFLSPLTLNLALGMDYKPNKYTSLFLSPLNAKYFYVKDKSLLTINSLDIDKHFRYELGFIAKFKYQQDVLKNLNVLSKLDVFADYLEFESLDDFDISWEVLLTMKVFKVISINFNSHLIWDNDVSSIDKEGNLGDPKIQFKEIFGAGFTYIF